MCVCYGRRVWCAWVVLLIDAAGCVACWTAAITMLVAQLTAAPQVQSGKFHASIMCEEEAAHGTGGHMNGFELALACKTSQHVPLEAGRYRWQHVQ